MLSSGGLSGPNKGRGGQVQGSQVGIWGLYRMYESHVTAAVPNIVVSGIVQELTEEINKLKVSPTLSLPLFLSSLSLPHHNALLPLPAVSVINEGGGVASQGDREARAIPAV